MYSLKHSIDNKIFYKIKKLNKEYTGNWCLNLSIDVTFQLEHIFLILNCLYLSIYTTDYRSTHDNSDRDSFEQVKL